MSGRLHALSPYDGRYEELGAELVPWFSEAGLIQARVIIETRYLLALSKEKIIRVFSVKEKELLKQYGHLDDSSFKKIKDIEKSTNHDVQAVVVFLRQEFSKSSLADTSEFIHFGLTSEDINNLAWRLGLVGARNTKLIPSINELIKQFSILAEKYKTLPMLARTHGQPAIPTTFGKELINVGMRLCDQRRKFEAFEFQGKMNGAIGNFSALSQTYPDTDWLSFSDKFIKELGFIPHHFTTQVNPNDDIVEYLQIIERINTILHGFAADMWRYISDDLVVQKTEGVGSSTMPQKINPIHFEHSEGVTEISNGLINVLVTRLAESRLQRDLSDTPLFRFLGEIHVTTLDAIRRISHSLTQIHPNVDGMHSMLWNNWVILAEPVQLILRKASVKNAYTIVKKYTQGKKFTHESWKATIELITRDCHLRDKTVLRQLNQLSPETYLGETVRLVELGLKELREDRH